MSRFVIASTFVFVLAAAPVSAREKVDVLPPGFAEVECPAGPGSSGPFLHTTPAGHVTMSWVEPEGDGHRLRFASWRDGAWSEPRTAAQGTGWFVNWADVPSVIAGDDGRMAAHWLAKSGEDTYAYDVRVSQSFDGGETWTTPITPHDDGTETEHGFASLFFDDDTLHLVWLDGRKYAAEDLPDEMTLRAARIDRKGNISGAVELDGRTCDCCPTAVAAIEGGFIVAYRDRSPEEIRDISVVRYVNGKWGPPQPVHADNWQINGCPVNGPAIASSGSDVAISWFTMKGTKGVVRGVWSSDGGSTFGDATVVAGNDPLGRVAATPLGPAGTVVAWLANDDEGAVIACRELSPAGAGGRARTIAYTSAARSSGYPRVTTLPDGRLLAAWTQSGDPSRLRTGTLEKQ